MSTITKRDSKTTAKPHDRGTQSYYVLLVTPQGKFTRRRGAVPAKWETVRPLHEDHLTRREYAQRDADRYNRQSLAHGWETWAIVLEHEGVGRFIEAGKTAGIRAPKQLPDGRVVDTGAELSINADWGYSGPCLYVSLRPGYAEASEAVTLDMTPQQMRERALEWIEQALLDVREAAESEIPVLA